MRQRLTVGQLVLWVGASALACGALFRADSDWIWMVFAAYPLLLLTRRGRPMTRWCPVVFALAVVALSTGGVRNVGVAFVAGIAILFVLAVSPLLIRHRDWRLHRSGLVALVASLIAMAAAAPTAWPVRLVFLASHRDLDDFAKDIEAGYRMTKPERVGGFLIQKAEMRAGRPCLWVATDPDAADDGFVRKRPRESGGASSGAP